MEHVYKKFRKGEVYNSLRDLLPALTGKMFKQQELSERDNREFWALQDISFEVKRGEALGIIGPNGAGKSTILKILSRIMKPTKGNLIVNGRLSALIEVSAGFHQDLTGRENIYLNGTILGMTRREIDSKLEQIIDFSGIEDFIDTPVKRYSSGMYARLGFSVAAHVDPDVLIVDEVLSVGDFVFQQKCLKRMEEVTRAGVAVLFVSHNLRSVSEFCTRCLLLDHGKVMMNGLANDVIQRYMNGERATVIYDDSKAVVISRVRIRDRDGESVRFESGEIAWVDVEVTARRPCAKMAVVLFVKDESNYEVFNTSTERLGCESFSLKSGETFACTFELRLNFANGTFHPFVSVFRYDTETVHDRLKLGAGIYIGSDSDVRGVVNCFPRVVRHEVLTTGSVAQVSGAYGLRD